MRVKVKKPNAIVYFIVYVFVYPFLKLFFCLKVDRSAYRPPKGPFLVVCNHQSFIDFVLAMLSMYPRRLNAVAARKFFFYKPLHKFLPLMGCIPKSLFDPDPASIIGMLRVLRRGGRVLLFPEGRCTVGGAYMGIHKSTGKLIQKLGVPVVSCRIDGSYAAMPFWREGMRRGRVRITYQNLLSADETQSLPGEALCARIDAALGGEAMPAKKPLAVFRQKRLAEGLEYILYHCPKCHAQFTLKTQGNLITCTVCGNTAAIDGALRLTPVDGGVSPPGVQAWYCLQTRHDMQRLANNPQPINTRVTLHAPLGPGKGVGPCGEGTLRLNPQGWHYAGTVWGEEARLFFPLDTVPAIPFDPRDDFQIYAHGKYYMFTAENPQAYSQIATVGECMYWRYATPVQMTPGTESGFS